MVTQSVVAIFDTLAHAKEAVQALEASDFPSQQVSLVTRSVTREVPQTKPLRYGDDTGRDVAKGIGVGGLAGLLLSAPLFLIAGVGPVLITGPLAAGMTGAVVGGFLGAMSGWGVHEDHLKQYEEQVKQGKFLVVANGDPEETAEAERVLRDISPEYVKLHAATSADAPEVDDTA